VPLTLARVALAIVEASSIPLLVLSLIYLVTGYQLLDPRIQILPRPRLIHTDRLLRIIAAAVGVAHGWAGLVLLSERRIRNKLLRTLVEALATGLTAWVVSFVVVVEMALLGEG